MSKVEEKTTDTSQHEAALKKGILLNDQIELLDSMAASQPPIDESHGWITYPALSTRLEAGKAPQEVQEMLAAYGLTLTPDQILGMSFSHSKCIGSGPSTSHINSIFKIVVDPDSSPVPSTVQIQVFENMIELNDPVTESDDGYSGPMAIAYVNFQRSESEYLTESLRRQQDFGLALCSVFMPPTPDQTVE